MDLNHRKPTRKIACPCRQCGREFFRAKRNGRRREFCSNACRQAHFRNAEFGRRYQTPDPLRNGQNNSTTSTTCKVENRGRGSIFSKSDWPINLLGHSSLRGPSPSIETKLRRAIIEAEI